MKKFKIELKWAIIFTLIFLAWMSFEHLMGWHGESIEKQATYTNLFGILAIIVYVLAVREKREKYYHEIMTWQQGFLSGSVLSVIIAAFTPVSQYIVHTFISPEFFQNLIDYSVAHTSMQEDAAEQYFNLSTYMFQSAFFSLSFGIVTAAVVAWFLKKEPKSV
ncbi:MAG TPA: DUF4199 domain-containing protein [Flavobacteriaceae bacterium]|nr:DUF4199 domain-containing protein [Flavobacteriaceae bacterium]